MVGDRYEFAVLIRDIHLRKRAPLRRVEPIDSVCHGDRIADEDRFVEGIKAKIPMGRLCRVEEVAEMVVFLSGPGCTFTTGGVFDLTGGRSVY